MIKVLAGLATAACGLLVVPVLAVATLLLGTPGAFGGACTPGGSLTVTIAELPGAVAGYTGEQLTNAAAIITTGAQLGVPARGQAIAVMTAMGESSLRVLHHGDAAGPDSRGLFQQRDNGAWGTLADRTNPATSAANFYRALLAVPGWQILEPSAAAHAVQRNADPDHYTPYWERALDVTAALAGAQVLDGDLACPPSATTAHVSTTGWIWPVEGRITSGFGMRVHPVTGARTLHAGIDIANRCGTPVHAAAAGTVTWAGGPYQGRTGNQIVINHGGGVITRYGHLLTGSLRVRVGDAVAQGQPIAAIGGDRALDPTGAGKSTGCHLHYEINLRGGSLAVDPIAFRG